MESKLNTGQPVAYIRRSVVRKGDPGDISMEFQTEKVRALAKADGPTLRILDGDWGRSGGRTKTDKRLAFLALIESISRGEVSILYAYSADRLARDVEWAARLLNVCEDHGTTIVTGEGRFAPGDNGARLLFQVLAVMNENALSGMTEKNTAVAGKRQERGDAMGRAPYGYRHEFELDADGKKLRSVLVPKPGEDPAAVVAAFKTAGTYNGAAALLSGKKGAMQHYADGSEIGIGIGLPTRFGKKTAWDASTVRHVVMREAKELVPTTRHQGSPARKSHRFARLLVCPHAALHGLDKDGNPNRPWLTVASAPKYTTRGGEAHVYGTRYYCGVAHRQSAEDHPRPYIVAESKVLAWAKKQVTREYERRVKLELKGKPDSAEAKLAALEAERELIWSKVDNLRYPMARAKADIARIDAQLPALESARRAVRPSVGLQPDGSFLLPQRPSAFDWSRDAAEINADLRDMWEFVELDPKTMEPVRAQWNIGKSPKDIAEAEAWAEARGEGPEGRDAVHDLSEWPNLTERPSWATPEQWEGRKDRQREAARLRGEADRERALAPVAPPDDGTLPF